MWREKEPRVTKNNFKDQITSFQAYKIQISAFDEKASTYRFINYVRYRERCPSLYGT
jgi:hypothetical protein